MSITALVASLPQIKSRRVAEDFIRELHLMGLKIVPDDAHAAAASQLVVKNPEHAARMVIT